MKRQQAIGGWTMGVGQLLLFVVMIVCIFDFAGMQERSGLMLPLSSYLTAIFTGVFMQILGAAIPNMRFANIEYHD